MHKEDNENLKYGTRVAKRAIVEIVCLSLLKVTVGYYTGLLVLFADALSSLADLVTLFASWLGLKISQRPADKNFKYGYYKAETFAAFVTSAVIIYLGAHIFAESIKRMMVFEPSRDQVLGVISVAISVLLSNHMSGYLQKAGRKINSLALINNGREKRMDILLQVAVLAGIGANYYHIPYLEGMIGLAISVMTLRVGFLTARESLFFLLDYFDDHKLIESVRRTIKGKARIVKSIHDIRMRRAGTFIFGEAFLEINPFAQTKDLRNELHNLQEKIKTSNKYLKDFLLFVVVPRPSSVKVAVPVREDKGLASPVAHTFGETKAYVFVEVKKDKIMGSYAEPFTFGEKDFGGIVRFITGHGPNIVIDNNMHSLLYYQLRRLHNIEIYPNFSNVMSVENTVKLLLLDT